MQCTDETIPGTFVFLAIDWSKLEWNATSELNRSAAPS